MSLTIWKLCGQLAMETCGKESWHLLANKLRENPQLLLSVSDDEQWSPGLGERTLVEDLTDDFHYYGRLPWHLVKLIDELLTEIHFPPPDWDGATQDELIESALLTMTQFYSSCFYIYDIEDDVKMGMVDSVRYTLSRLGVGLWDRLFPTIRDAPKPLYTWIKTDIMRDLFIETYPDCQALFDSIKFHGLSLSHEKICRRALQRELDLIQNIPSEGNDLVPLVARILNVETAKLL